MAVLNRCPHCDGLGTLWSENGLKTVYAVCMSCGARTKDCISAKEAVKIWNKRATKSVNITKLSVELNSATNIRPQHSAYEGLMFKNDAEIYTEINRLKYKLFDMKWNCNSREGKQLLDRCIEMVDGLPTIKISRGETK